MKTNYKYILFFLNLFFYACIPNEKVAPILPKIESSIFNFSYFEKDAKEDTHFSFVSEKVLKWKALLEDSLNIHHAILNNAAQNEFDFQKDNTWLNNFSFNIEDKGVYKAHFFCITEVDTVLYKSFISYDYFSDIIFLDGKTYNDAQTGEWEFLKVQRIDTTKIKFLTANWDFYKKNKIKFINNQAGENNLNYIMQMDSVEDKFNKYIDIYNKGAENHSLIQWNSLTKVGRVKDKLRFSNDDWHYWDSNLEDIN